ncbi:MAG: PilZ domain-containing protein [Alphaproteobacteria bacterium]|nr:PilZ domain-containing protein [Alphaproteobacteria bacterium]
MESTVPIARTAIVRSGTATFEARVHACYADRAMLAFIGAHPPTFALGATVQLVLSGGRLRIPVRGDARVVERVEGRGLRQYTLEFDEVMFAEDAAPETDRERRLWTRVRPPSDNPVPIVLSPITAQGRVRMELDRYGRLVDVSGGGLGVLLRDGTEGPLAGHEAVRVSFRPPRTTANVERDCRIRSRALTEHGIRLGLQLETVEDESLAYEPMWDCAACGERGLLETSQPYCCRCGAVRDTDAEVAAWGDLIARSQHRFTGRERGCTACGGTWSAEARHCGLCGTALPV